MKTGFSNPQTPESLKNIQIEKLSAVDWIIFSTVTGMLAFTVLSGAVLPVLPFFAVEMVIFSLLVLWLTDRLIFSRKSELKWVALPPVLLMIIFLLFTGMQMVPLPGEIIRLISPHAFSDKIQAADLLALAHDLPVSDKGWMTTTPYLYPARCEWLKSAAGLGLFFLIIHTIKSARQIKILVIVMLLAGLPAAAGIIFQATGMWERTGGVIAGLNYSADYMAMLLLLTFGYLIAVKKKSRRLMPGLQSKRANIQKIIGLFSPETARPHRIFFFFCAAATGTALILAASRACILFLALVLILIGILFFLKPGFRRYGSIALVMGLLALVWWPFAEITPDAEKRTLHSHLLIPMIKDYAAAGAGPGNFKYIYPRYRQLCDFESGPGNIGQSFLKALVEYGIVSAVIALFALGTLFYRLLRIWLRRKNDALATGLGAAAVGCMLLAGVYPSFGPGMWTGYNCFFLIAISALGYCALFRQGYGFSEKFFWKTGTLKLTRWRRILLLVPALTGWMLMINLTVENLRAEIFPIKNAALIFDPNFKGLLCKNENRLKEMQTGDPASDKKTLLNLEKALQDNPGWGKNWYLLGKCYALQREDAYRYLGKWLPLAEQCFEQGLKRLPCDADMLFSVAGYWVWRSSILADDGFRGKSIKKFQKLFKRSLAIRPENWQAAAAMVWQYFPQDAVVMGIVPEGGDLKSRVLKWTVQQKTS